MGTKKANKEKHKAEKAEAEKNAQLVRLSTSDGSVPAS